MRGSVLHRAIWQHSRSRGTRWTLENTMDRILIPIPPFALYNQTVFFFFLLLSPSLSLILLPLPLPEGTADPAQPKSVWCDTSAINLADTNAADQTPQESSAAQTITPPRRARTPGSLSTRFVIARLKTEGQQGDIWEEWGVVWWCDLFSFPRCR